ncbi:mechanosensitive ion channel family protein [Microbulbifer sp. YPW1]|uniref:mechanosensitive ion channel family protein n=1 Tax=Microbulbifer sp. YPW1 TaxID=2745199 RepID=UPI0015992057|nr:mechanosensitive ion channel family protein [Microbulbifer sp. YPW1]QKX18675.1 mechanosensitive ion channel family protein [Microbulbifer sp. YPW1]
MQNTGAQTSEAGQQNSVSADYSAAIDQVDSWVDGAIKLIPNFTVALLVLLIAFILGSIFRFVVRRHLTRRDRSNLGEVLGSLVKWSVILVGFLLAATIVMPSLKPGDLIAGLGVGSVAIGFAFKDILQNWLAGLLILVRQPFEIGDQIKVADFEGTVHRIETRATLIDTYDGQRVVMPNSDIYTNAVLVKTAHTKRRSDFEIGIGYSDSIGEACDVIRSAVTQVEGVQQSPAPEALPWELAASWVTIRARWWTNSAQTDVTHIRARVIQSVKEALDEAGIDMPFETQVHLFHDQTDESDGKPGQQREGWPAPPANRGEKQAGNAERERGTGNTGPQNK